MKNLSWTTQWPDKEQTEHSLTTANDDNLDSEELAEWFGSRFDSSQNKRSEQWEHEKLNAQNEIRLTQKHRT